MQKKQIKKKGFSRNNIKEKKFNDYEMLEEYDFNDIIRGRFYKPKKIPVSLKLDNDMSAT